MGKLFTKGLNTARIITFHRKILKQTSWRVSMTLLTLGAIKMWFINLPSQTASIKLLARLIEKQAY